MERERGTHRKCMWMNLERKYYQFVSTMIQMHVQYAYMYVNDVEYIRLCIVYEMKYVMI